MTTLVDLKKGGPRLKVPCRVTAVSAATTSLDRGVPILLIVENQIADDHAVIGVDRSLGEHGFGAETSTGPNLVNAEQRETIGTRVPPSTPRLTKCVAQPWS